MMENCDNPLIGNAQVVEECSIPVKRYRLYRQGLPPYQVIKFAVTIIRIMVVILQDIRSLYNVGSIFRTADAVGAGKIYLTGITPTPVDRFGEFSLQLTKVSLGAEKVIPWEKIEDIAICISKLKKSGFKIIAIEQSPKATPYYKLKAVSSKLEKVALVLGPEVTGLPESTLSLCDIIIEIPMRGKTVKDQLHPKNQPKPHQRKESLNVAVAFGIVAFRLRENISNND